MKAFNHWLGASVLLLVCLVIGGCSSGFDAGNSEDNELEQVWNLYRGGPKAMRARPPSKLEELKNQRTLYPRGYSALQQRTIVVAWGTDLSRIQNPEATVLAYEKQTPSEGGSVLMADGAIKTMTAQEFQAAHKGKK
jgi:Tfp pilus assembly protein PilP